MLYDGMLTPTLNPIEAIRQCMAQIERATGVCPTTLKLGRKTFVTLSSEADPLTKTEVEAMLGLKVKIVGS